MEINLEELKKNFAMIKDIRSKVTNVFDILETHLIKLKHTYLHSTGKIKSFDFQIGNSNWYKSFL
jgi:hypothetical protein